MRTKAPKNLRRSKRDPKIKEFIKELRLEHPRSGKDKIRPELDLYCQKMRLETISEPTIGRIIKELKEKIKYQRNSMFLYVARQVE